MPRPGQVSPPARPWERSSALGAPYRFTIAQAFLIVKRNFTFYSAFSHGFRRETSEILFLRIFCRRAAESESVERLFVPSAGGTRKAPEGHSGAFPCLGTIHGCQIAGEAMGHRVIRRLCGRRDRRRTCPAPGGLPGGRRRRGRSPRSRGRSRLFPPAGSAPSAG